MMAIFDTSDISLELHRWMSVCNRNKSLSTEVTYDEILHNLINGFVFVYNKTNNIDTAAKALNGYLNLYGDVSLAAGLVSTVTALFNYFIDNGFMEDLYNANVLKDAMVFDSKRSSNVILPSTIDPIFLCYTGNQCIV